MRTLGVKGIQVSGNRKDRGPEEGCSWVLKDEQEGQHAWSGDRSDRTWRAPSPRPSVLPTGATGGLERKSQTI